ncbi:hypothetical protein TKK_0008169 [Trichogramma kaykai]
MNYYNSTEGLPSSDSSNHNSQMQFNDRVRLTPEEQRVLSQCLKEGIVTRAIPLAILGGVGAFAGAKFGILSHARWGAKPAVIGFSLLGYFIGRISYSNVCVQRVLEVPDGNMRKILPHLNKSKPRENIDDIPMNYVTVEGERSPNQLWTRQSVSTDIDVASTSSFDTIPSDYYPTQSETLTQEPKHYTSYDDLRNKNRQEYNNRLYPEGKRNIPQQGYAAPAPIEPPVYRRPEPRDQYLEGTQKNKYGDVWGT